jgi:nitroreductase
VLILISANAQEPWIVEDCALAAENLMLAAYAAGLGTCWIGFAQGFFNTVVGKELALFDSCVPVAPIIVGRQGTRSNAGADARSRFPSDVGNRLR